MSNKIQWKAIQNIPPQRYCCGHCGADVASDQGWRGAQNGKDAGAVITICPNCTYPSFHPKFGPTVPGVRYGNEVSDVEDDEVKDLYDEARNCTSAGAHTAAVLCCRKIIMHVAVAKDAEENKSFAYYVDFLAREGYLPPDGREWVDHIRRIGNQANHEISLASRESSEELISFIEMLLKFIYEFPARLRNRDGNN